MLLKWQACFRSRSMRERYALGSPKRNTARSLFGTSAQRSSSLANQLTSFTIFQQRLVRELELTAIGSILRIEGTDVEISVTDLLSRKFDIPFDSDMILLSVQQIYERFGEAPVTVDAIRQAISLARVMADQAVSLSPTRHPSLIRLRRYRSRPVSGMVSAQKMCKTPRSLCTNATSSRAIRVPIAASYRRHSMATRLPS
jgi:hypothetical protein